MLKTLQTNDKKSRPSFHEETRSGQKITHLIVPSTLLTGMFFGAGGKSMG